MNIAQAIDHTLLKPDATRADILRICAEAREFGFFSVCVNSSRVSLAAEALRGSDVLVESGAGEIDTVIAVGPLKDGDESFVLDDLAGVVEAAGRAKVKVILETCLLTDEEKLAACRIACEAGAGFVKTSTGFSSGGATIEDVGLMAAAVAGRCLVKASGGIRDAASARAMLGAGASRLGTSNGIAIVKGLTASQGY